MIQHNKVILYFIDFQKWKQKLIQYFFNSSNNQIIFLNQKDYSEIETLNSEIYIWGNKNYTNLEVYLEKHTLPLYRLEDGFIRSVSLGLEFSQPYSLIVDKKNIYFDATKESDLEYILQNKIFDEDILERAEKVQKYLVENKLSKYNIFNDIKIKFPNKKNNQKSILIVGQVEGDASLVYGADNMKNLELLQRVREDNPHAYLVYKAHPDVLSGKREGHIPQEMLFKYADHKEEKVSIDSLLCVVDEVATMTSLVGMEALMRKKPVTCYGLPFYAGWGLTTDKKSSQRRTKVLTLNELVAATYIVYPKYISPKTLKICEIEEVMEQLAKDKEKYHNSLSFKIRIKMKNFITIKYYAVLRHINKGKI